MTLDMKIKRLQIQQSTYVLCFNHCYYAIQSLFIK